MTLLRQYCCSGARIRHTVILGEDIIVIENILSEYGSRPRIRPHVRLRILTPSNLAENIVGGCFVGFYRFGRR